MTMSICLSKLTGWVTSISIYFDILSTCSIYALLLMVGLVANLDTMANFCMSEIINKNAAKGNEMRSEDTRAKLLVKIYYRREERKLVASRGSRFPKARVLICFALYI